MTAKPVLASLAAFIGAGLRPTSPLARAIVVVLAIKLVAIAGFAIYQSVANPNTAVDAAAVAHLLSPASRP